MARSQRWFGIDFDWIGVNFSTREPDFYKKHFQSHDNTQGTNKFKFFQVPIEIQNVWNHLSFKMMPQYSIIVRNHLIAVVSVV